LAISQHLYAPASLHDNLRGADHSGVGYLSSRETLFSSSNIPNRLGQ